MLRSSPNKELICTTNRIFIKQQARKIVKKSSLDTNENFWSLGCILGVSIGIPGMLIGSQLAKVYGVKAAIIPICIAHLILWTLGLGIITMAQKKTHAIENVKKYFGRWSGRLSALIFTLAFLNWYTQQLDGISSIISNLFYIDTHWKTGALLGLFTATLALGGFKIIKWICILSTPILIGLAIYFSINCTSTFKYSNTIPLSSFATLPIILIAWLPGTVNLPTFFRHSKSRSNSILALSVVMILHIIFQFLIISSDINMTTLSQGSSFFEMHSPFYLTAITVFSLLSFICINLTNIYFVSACSEMVFPHDYGHKKYMFLGVIGTIAYICLEFIETKKAVLMIESLISYFMTILLLSLLINFLVSIAVKHRLLYLSKLLGSMSWIFGCIATVISLAQNPSNPNKSLFLGCITTVLFSVITVFIEETIWAIKTLREKKKI